MVHMTSKIKKSDFVKICRTCLLQKDNMLQIHSSNIVDMLRTFTQIQIVSNDGLPCSICLECYEKIYSSFIFKNLCEDSDWILRQALLECDSDWCHSDSNCNNLDLVKVEDIGEAEDFVEAENVVKVEGVAESENVVEVEDIVKVENTVKVEFDTNISVLNDKNHKPISNTYTNARLSKQVMRKKTKDVVGPFSCKICKKVYQTQLQFNQHHKIHTRQGKYKCDECGMGFRSNHRLVKHATVHRPIQKCIPCVFCDKKLSSQPDLKAHCDRYHKGKSSKRTVCTICGKAFVNIKQYVQKHAIDPNDKLLSCERCSEQNHVLTHTDEWPFACKLCDKKYKSMHSLNYHKKTHGKRSFTCSVCSKGFYLTKILRNHMRTHTGERPFVCRFCSKTFAQKATLWRHMRMH